jgi:DNA polymerase-1
MATKSDRLVLVDGSWLIFRAFFALPSNLATRSGLHTNAIFGFATMLRKLFAGKRPTSGAVIFDAPGPTHRDEKFAAYKAERPPIPDTLAEQFPWIERLVQAHGFPILRVPGLEGDDVIGTLATEAANAGLEVLIVAGDKDFAQLISDNVRMFDPMRDVTFDAELVYKKWGVPPSRIVDLLAFMGDTIDGIPGVPGIGQKGATTLLEKYGSFDGVYAHLNELPARQRATFTENRAIAELSRELATIVKDAPLPIHVADLRLTDPDDAVVQALYRELEFYSLLGEKGATTDVKVEVTSEAFVPGADIVAIAPALTGNDGGAGVLEGLYVCSAPGKVFRVADPAALREWLADPSRPKVAHDVKALRKALRRVGLDIAGADDTMLASFLVEPTKCIPHRLEQVAREYLQQPLAADAKPEVRADAIARLRPVLFDRLGDLTDHYRRVELPLAAVLGDMEMAGILVDREDLGRMGVEFTARKEALEAQIHELAGHPFNIGSTAQLGTVLFEELKLPVVKKTKTGWSTDAEVLETLAPKHAIARLILEQRMLAKLINTYTDVLQRAVDPRTGRVHATFQQTVGVSGRLISTDPDLQRTPVRTVEGKRIRRAFIAPPGYRILSADWSQIELRVLAHFCADPGLVTAFREGLDVHRRTAGQLFNVPLDEVTPAQRNVGKTINFATIYGQGATALAQILGIPRKEAQAHIDAFFRTYAGVREWLTRTIAEASERGYVTTLLGRKRSLPELSSRSPQDRQAGERIAANTPIQGSAADLCKLAMLTIHEKLRGRDARMLLQVHDELVFEVAEAEVTAVTDIVRTAMESPYPLAVPLVVSIGVGATWGDAH